MSSINLYIGKKFTKQLVYKDSDGDAIDITDYVLTASIKRHPDSTALVELDSDGGGLTLGGADGTIDIVIDEATTAGFEAGSYSFGFSHKTGAAEEEQFFCEFGINIRKPIDEQ